MFSITNHAFLPRKIQVDTPEGYLFGGWTNRLKVTIPAGKVLQAVANLPVLISVTHADLRPAPDGKGARTDGLDIAFTADEDGERLPFDLLSYDPNSGTVVGYVRPRVVSNALPTVLWLYNGNPDPALLPYQRNAVWSGDAIVDADLGESPLGARFNAMVVGDVTEGVGLNDLPSLVFAGGHLSHTSQSFTKAFTVAVWVKCVGVQSEASLVDCRSADQGFRLWLDGTTVHVSLQQSGQPVKTLSRVASAIFDGGWHTIAFTFDADHADLYLDSFYVNTMADCHSGEVCEPGVPCLIGKDFTGQLSVVEIARVVRGEAALRAKRANFIDPTGWSAVGTSEAVPTIVRTEEIVPPTPISLDDVDLDDVDSTANAVFQSEDRPIATQGGLEIPNEEWIADGKDVASKFFDPETSATTLANVERYLNPDFLRIDEFLPGPCCARFKFLSTDPTIPIFLQYLPNGGTTGWSDEVVDGDVTYWTYCGTCGEDAILAELPDVK